jgi:hypothetical protein
LISDDDDEWWVVCHRVVSDWASDDELVDDVAGHRLVWAVESAYPQVYVSGTVYNELLVTAEEQDDHADAVLAELEIPPDGAELDRRDMLTGNRHRNLRRDLLTPEQRILSAAVDVPDEIVHRESDDFVRRTWIRRGHGEIHGVGVGIARECAEMLRADVPVPPSPSPPVCARCAFLAPCLELESGRDAESVLAALYRPRRSEEFDEAALRRSGQRDRERAFFGGAAARRSVASAASEPTTEERT